MRFSVDPGASSGPAQDDCSLEQLRDRVDIIHQKQEWRLVQAVIPALRGGTNADLTGVDLRVSTIAGAIGLTERTSTVWRLQDQGGVSVGLASTALSGEDLRDIDRSEADLRETSVTREDLLAVNAHWDDGTRFDESTTTSP